MGNYAKNITFIAQFSLYIFSIIHLTNSIFIYAMLVIITVTFIRTKRFSSEEILKGPYDVDVLWAPLYTGEFKTIKDVSYSSSTGLISLSSIFGLSGGRDAGDDYMSEVKINVLTKEHLSESKKMMLTNMDNLLKSC